MRIIVKGGVWKNSEDEILKAAVMKYGKNQWARISSLLVRKTPKQCKARWYEWLDPSIKKTEWSKDEDEKLLHLAKIMPCQWRSIAPIIKRTPAQCLERYEQLLDRAQGREDEGDKGDDPRKLKPGEVDPSPETKPARPDPVDMDEDEKEMLAEARARLANTQGKKAKRKAREKQLEEAKKLATLQKRRELKAAGIRVSGLGLGLFRRRKGKFAIDFNREIPFEKPVPAGFYDVAEENMRKRDEIFEGRFVQKQDAKKLHEIEAEQRKEAERKYKEKKQAPPVVSQLSRMAEIDQMRKRPRLNLPAPQVSDSELEDIVKIGQAGESVKSAVEDESPNPASRTLLANYTVATPASLAQRTPRTPAGVDTVMREAQNIIALNMADTPLKGGMNTPLHETSFAGITPQRAVVQTPNVVMANLTPRAGYAAGGQATATPRTVKRDELSINRTDEFDETSSVSSTPRMEKARQKQMRQQLSHALKGLPQPKNEFEIVLPDLTEEEPETDDKAGTREEDAVDTLRRDQVKQKQLDEAEFKSRSQAVQRSLPRPAILNAAAFESDQSSKYSEADALIKKEMHALLKQDAVLFPPPGALTQALNATSRILLETFEADEIAQAVQLIELEERHLHADIDGDQFAKEWEAVYRSTIFVPSKKHADHIASLQNELQLNRSRMMNDAKKATKLEGKLNILLGGYQTRAFALAKQMNETVKQLDKARREFVCFQELAGSEKVALSERLDKLRSDVQQQRNRENELQKRYGSLVVEYEMLTSAPR